MSTKQDEYRFKVDPAESLDEREARWDSEIRRLRDLGLTIEGVGPDGDWPIRNEPVEGESWEDFWNQPTGPFTEVYNLVPVIAGQWAFNPETNMYEPQAVEMARD